MVFSSVKHHSQASGPFLFFQGEAWAWNCLDLVIVGSALFETLVQARCELWFFPVNFRGKKGPKELLQVCMRLWWLCHFLQVKSKNDASRCVKVCADVHFYTSSTTIWVRLWHFQVTLQLIHSDSWLQPSKYPSIASCIFYDMSKHVLKIHTKIGKMLWKGFYFWQEKDMYISSRTKLIFSVVSSKGKCGYLWESTLAVCYLNIPPSSPIQIYTTYI